MALFFRSQQPPSFTLERRYKPFLRADFQMRCAYCERPEEYLGGAEAFEVEHFRPKGKFPEFHCCYSNLYYACRGCNAHKSEAWPTELELALGMSFADPCEADPYVHHLIEEVDGGVVGKTPAGKYTCAHIRLHRDELKKWRRLRVQALEDLPRFAAMLRDLKQLQGIVHGSEHAEIDEKISSIGRYIEDVKARFRIG